MKFKATTAGTINGIRFYKGPQNTGTHIGSLWTIDGQLLASATLHQRDRVRMATGELPRTREHRRQHHLRRLLPQHIRVLFSDKALLHHAVRKRPLIAPASSAEGGNGTYTYGATNAFPTSSYQASNYWVDVVFTPSNSLWNNSTVPAAPSFPNPRPLRSA